jgi:hypothetical protein
MFWRQEDNFRTWREESDTLPCATAIEYASLEGGRRAARPLSLRRGDHQGQMGRRSVIGSHISPKTAIFVKGAQAIMGGTRAPARAPQNTPA